MNEISICITTTTDKYLKYTATLIQSLLNNLNSNFQYNVYILSNDKIHKKIQNKILGKKNSKINITFIYIDENIFNGYNNLKNKILLYRLILPDYIAKDRILFMDCDTIITGDISELYSIDLGNNIIAASKDCTLWDTPILKNYNVDKYFNAGIQVINLKKWKEYEIGKKTLDFLNINYNKLPHYEQDALNIILKDKWLCISPKWNGININSFASKWTQYSKKEFYEVKHPITIHYAGSSNRPWGHICIHPKRYLYYKYIFKTKFWDISDIYKLSWRILTSNHLCLILYKIIRFTLFIIRKK